MYMYRKPWCSVDVDVDADRAGLNVAIVPNNMKAYSAAVSNTLYQLLGNARHSAISAPIRSSRATVVLCGIVLPCFRVHGRASADGPCLAVC